MTASLPTQAEWIAQRSRQLAAAQIAGECELVSGLFGWLLIFQWIAVVLTAICLSPRTWAGTVSTVHPHVWMAFLLGLVITSVPLLLARFQPRASVTRHAVAVGQMLMGSLLIHVSGGRIENHFHIFGSLAFLAFYRDVRVILTATLVVTLDHVLRGIWFPQSIYGVLEPQFWRTIEHAVWVVFEDVILLIACRKGIEQAGALALRRAELELSNRMIEARVQERTREVEHGQKALSESERNHRNLFDDSPVGMYRATPDGRILFANSRLMNMTGYSSLEDLKAFRLDGAQLLTLLHPSSHLQSQSELLPFNNTWTRKNGSDLRVSGAVRVFYDDTGNPMYLDGAIEDVTDQSRIEELERDRNSVLEMVSRNRPLDEILHRIRQLLSCQIPEVRSSIHLGPDAIHSSRSGAQQLISSEGVHLGTLLVALPEAGDPQVFERKAIEEAARLAVIAIDHHSLYQKLAHQASYDPLTDLPNRVFFEAQFAQALAEAKLSGERLALFWIDVDRFKHINDTMGHEAGDALLREISSRLQTRLTPGDILARMGGDEYAIVIRNIEDTRNAEQAARNLLELFENSTFLQPHQVFISATLGISLFPQDGTAAGELLANADIAMNHAKNDGRNRYVCFSPDMAERLLRRRNLETQMKTALARNEFELYYQPQVSLASTDCRAIIAVEALLRWNNPALGRVSPGEFIPVAEETGSILSIGEWVLKQACRQSVAWRAAGLPPIRIAVNVSALQFSRPDFLPNVESILAATGMNPALLEIELTETSLMQNLDVSNQKIRRLRDLRISVAIDDFGTGYCSLSYLQNLSASIIKIDQSFVRGISVESPGRTAILQAIVDMARSLRLQVVAEGVETEYQFSELERIGCNTAQGYLLSMPLPCQAIEELLMANASSRVIYSLARSIESSVPGNLAQSPSTSPLALALQNLRSADLPPCSGA